MHGGGALLGRDIEENIGVDKIPAPATVDRELEPSDMPTDKQLNKKAVAKHQDAWDKTARTWGKVLHFALILFLNVTNQYNPRGMQAATAQERANNEGT